MKPGPSEGLVWGKNGSVVFDVEMGEEARSAADFWLSSLRQHPPETRMNCHRVMALAEVVYRVALRVGGTRFQLTDHEATQLAGLKNVDAWQNFRRMMHRMRWLDVRVGTQRSTGKAGRKSNYALNLPATLFQSVEEESLRVVVDGSHATTGDTWALLGGVAEAS